MHRVNKICNHLSAAPQNAQLAPQPTSLSGDYKRIISAIVESSKPEKVVKTPMKVVVTGAAGNIGYAIVNLIARGHMLGKDQPIDFRLLDIEPMQKSLQGVKMEIIDGAFPAVNSIVCTADYQTAFSECDVALLIGARPRGPGMKRADLLKANAAIFEGQGKALNKWANRNVKVVVVGNPANTNALIAMKNAPDLSPSCFSALTRLDQNRTNGMIAGRTGLGVSQIKNVVIWGNHSATMFPDINHGVVTDYPSAGMRTPIRSVVNNDSFCDGELITLVQKRGSAIIQARGKSSAASAANAAVDHIRSWVLGTAPGEWCNMAVWSDGSRYGIPRDIMYSVPVTCNEGTFKVVDGLQINSAARVRMDATAKELLGEREAALGF